jgi:hypothetical protein
VREIVHEILRYYLVFGNATNNLWVLNFSPDLFYIRQAELELIITLSTMRIHGAPKVFVTTFAYYYYCLIRKSPHLEVISNESESYVTTDSQSASLSWNKSPIWGLRPDVY